MSVQDYSLNIDGPLLRQQREMLISLAEAARNGRHCELGPRQTELLEGLVDLTDELADQAHDRHGIDCLLGDASHQRMD